MKILLCFAVLFVIGCSDHSANPRTLVDNGTTTEELEPNRGKETVTENANASIVETSANQAAGNPLPTGLVRPKDLVYQGAFRLPVPSGGSNWEYSGYAMTYYPGGDPEGPDDGFPGSIFAVGHDHHQMVSEIGIPIPQIRADKTIDKLAVAETIQPFHDIRGDLVGDLEIPRAGLEYLPSSDPSQPGKLHFCWGQHFQFERDASHGWSELTLANPAPKGLWGLGFTNYVTNDYLFEIPASWSDSHLPGYRLMTGRFRDGLWGGRGPALLAYMPPNESALPAPDSALETVKPLLMYGRPQVESAELEINDQWQMSGFSEADEWSGGAWLTTADNAAVVLVGTKATGKTWYGFSNGVVYPTSGDPNDPVPPVPEFPHDARGWWSEDISAQILFFDPADLAAVAKGEAEPWFPQPYGSLTLDEYLFDAGFNYPRYKRYLLGACCFDRERGILYIFERQIEQDEDRSLIHVFQIEPKS